MNPYASHPLPTKFYKCVCHVRTLQKQDSMDKILVTHPPDRGCFYFLVASMKINKQPFKLPRKEKPLYPYSFCLFIQVLLLLLC